MRANTTATVNQTAASFTDLRYLNNTDLRYLTNQDWFSVGKQDAWCGRSKQPPEHDTEAASLYDLGYSEGEIEPAPTQPGLPPTPPERD
jgi:hypothetical protein